MTRPITPTMWTDARNALLRELVAAGNTRALCIEPINALPGDPITTERQIGRQMARLGIKLPPDAYRAVYRAGAAEGRFGRRAMTPERLAYLLQASVDRVPYDVMLVALNALPGLTLKSAVAIRHHARKNGISRPRPPRHSEHKRLEREREERANVRRNAKRKAARAASAASWQAPREHAPPMAKRAKIHVMQSAAHDPAHLVQFIEPSPEIADAVTEDRYARVKAALRKKGADAAALARVHGMPLREAYRLAGEVRREMRA